MASSQGRLENNSDLEEVNSLKINVLRRDEDRDYMSEYGVVDSPSSSMHPIKCMHKCVCYVQC